MITSDELNKIEAQGYDAGEHGAPRGMNPHRRRSLEWYAWNCGWESAVIEYADHLPADRFSWAELIAAAVAVGLAVWGLGYGLYYAVLWIGGYL